MEELIGTLKAQHQAVTRMVTDITQALKRRDRANISLALVDFRKALTAHLELEDHHLYPELIRAAERQNNRDVVDLAQSFASNMAYVSRVLTDFLRRYEGKEFTLEDFDREWKTIASTLGTRVSAEERTLYRQYERLVLGKAA